MNKFLAVMLIVAVMCSFAVAAWAQSGTLVKPYALNLPYGAEITTEVNLSEQDLLPTIKGLIPMIGELARMGAVQQMGAQMSPGVGEMGAQMMSGIEDLDTKPLAEAVEGVKAIRVLSGTFPRHSSPRVFQMEFEKGLAKSGTFTNIIRHVQDVAVGVYAQSNNGGYVAYMYDAKKGTVAAARLVGFLDIQKIMDWGMAIAKKAAQKQQEMTPPPAEPEATTPDAATPESEPATPAVEPEPATSG